MEVQVIKASNKRPDKLRVAAYARVSTAHEEQENSLDNQIRYYKDLISANPEYELAGSYHDFGISRFKETRPGFQRMMADARAGKIDFIITKSITRFARNTDTVLKYLLYSLSLLLFNRYKEFAHVESLYFKQPYLLIHSSCISCEIALRAHNSVTWDDYRYRIMPYCSANSLGRHSGHSSLCRYLFCYPSVCGGLAVWDFKQDFPDFFAEISSFHMYGRQEARVSALKVYIQPFGGFNQCGTV